MTAREAILTRIRKANGPDADAAEAHSAWQRIPRAYSRVAARDRETVLLLLEDRLRDYDAGVERCAVPQAPEAIARLLAGRSRTQVLMPEGVPLDWLPAGFDFVPDQEFTPLELDRFEGVVTCATVAIGETGTVVLQNVPGQGRRAVSLVPDYHLCIVRVADVVATVPEAMARLQPTAHLPTTFISGPSATADIEMTRIKGVHGPRFLDVLLLD